MKNPGFRICAFLLAFALAPGAFEVMENAAHLLTEGHLAHAAADGDQHAPAGPEHGCTPIFHTCGCHASLAFLGTPALPAIALRPAGISRQLDPDPRLTGFRQSIDHPPRV